MGVKSARIIRYIGLYRTTPPLQTEGRISESYFLFCQPHMQSMIKLCSTLFEERVVSILLKEEGGADAPT